MTRFGLQVIPTHQQFRSGALGALMSRRLRRAAFLGAMCMSVVACVAESNPEPAAASTTATQAESNSPSAAERGLALARENCATCHAVEAGQNRSPNAAAPAFEELASRPEMTRMALATLLQIPHRSMPNLILEPNEIDDLSAYLSVLGSSN